MKNNQYFKTLALLLALYLLPVSFVEATNALPGDLTGGGGTKGGKCKSCVSCSGAANQGLLCRSLYWSLSLGEVYYKKPSDFLALSNAGISKGSVGGALPRNLNDVLSAFAKGGASARYQLLMRISSPTIDASLADPKNLTVDRIQPSRIITKNEFINQVETDTAYTKIEKLTDGSGFSIKMWSKSKTTFNDKTNELYTFPTEEEEAQDPNKKSIVKIIFQNPDHPLDKNRILKTTIEHFGGADHPTTKLFEETFSENKKPKTLTITTYKGIATPKNGQISGDILEIEKLAYFNRTGRVWDYDIERKIWRAHTLASGEITSPSETPEFLTLHNYEEYKDFTLNSKVGGEKGARRQTRLVVGYQSPNPQETIYKYYDTKVNTDITDETHGRLRSVTHPDGSWDYYEYGGSTTSSVASEKKYSSWKDITLENREQARKVTTSIEAKNLRVTTEINKQIITIKEVNLSEGKDSSTITETRTLDASGKELSISTESRYSSGDSAIQAGKLKWAEYPDGTAAIYSYAKPNSDLEVTIKTGAGNRNRISSGTRTVQTFNAASKMKSQVVTDLTSGSTLSAWFASDPDNKGRFQRKNYILDGTYEKSIYGCCGIISSRDRSGTTSEYFRDDFKRAYRVRSKVSTNSPTIDTTTAYLGTTTTVNRRIGTDTRLVSTSTRTLDGSTSTTLSPDADGDGAPEQTTRVTLNNPSGGTTTTTTYPDTTTTSTITYIDGKTKSSTDQLGNTTTYTYGIHTENGNGIYQTITPPNTAQWIKTYSDPLGRTYKTQYPDGATATQTYYPATAAPAGSRNKLATATDPDGITTTYTYNAEGERTTTISTTAGNNTITSVTDTSIVTDPDIGVASKTTSTINGILTSTSYRSVDGLKSKNVSLNGTSTTVKTLPTNGAWTTTSTTPDGQTSVQTYTKGRLDKTETFDNASTPLSIASTTYAYDTFGRTTSTTDSRTGATTINAYTEAGQPLSVTTNGGNDTTTYTYDKMGRRLTTTLPDNSITHTSYTKRGQTLATWGSQTYARLYQYDAQGRMSQLRTYQNLPHGTQPTLTTTGYATTHWNYGSKRGWLTSKRDAKNKGADYTYTPAGRLKKRTWARGTTTTYAYDKGSLHTVTYSDATPAITYTYDTLGRPHTITQGTNTHTYAYDPTKLVLDTETIKYGTAFTRIIDRSQDNLLRPTGFQLKNDTTTELTTAYTYDTAGRLHTLSNGTDTFTYNYLANTYGIVESVTSPAHTVTNTYEPHRNVLTNKKNSDNSVNSIQISNFAYTINKLGQRTALTTSGKGFDGSAFTNVLATGPAYKWRYNKAGELVSADDTNSVNNDRAYKYDSIGNRTQSGTAFSYTPEDELVITNPLSYTSNALNQYITPPSEPPALSYDEDGNLIVGKLHTISNDDTTAIAYDAQLIWDAENRLIEVKTSAGTSIATYAYDYQGRRISKTANGITTYSIYDGWNKLADYTTANSTPTIQKTYLWGMDLSGSMQGAGGVGGLLAVNELSIINSQLSIISYYPTYDGNGNVSEYVSEAGEVVAHYEYDGFGNTLLSNGAKANDFAYRFSTKPLDAETGLYYYGYRYYDPVTGRWPSRDPIMELGGENLYGFILNDPIGIVDLLGLDVVVQIGLGTGSGVSGGNPLGHTALGIPGMGAYSPGTNQKFGPNFTDYLANQNSYRDSQLYVIATTPGQDAAIAKEAKKLGTKIPDKDWSDNCSTRVTKALKAGGVPIDGKNNLPAELQRDLDKLVKQGKATIFFSKEGSKVHPVWKKWNP